MGYENAPATKLLATHCICCGLPLLDALSVERSIGPICFEKHGGLGDADASDEDRVKANRLVREAALNGCSAERRVAIAKTIEGLGFARLAARIIERFGRRADREARVKVTKMVYLHRNLGFRGDAQAKVLFLHTPWGNEAREFNSEFKACIPQGDRTGQRDPQDGNKFWWIVREQHRGALLALLGRFYRGFTIETEDAQWEIGTPEPTAPTPTPVPLPAPVPATPVTAPDTSTVTPILAGCDASSGNDGCEDWGDLG